MWCRVVWYIDTNVSKKLYRVGTSTLKTEGADSWETLFLIQQTTQRLFPKNSNSVSGSTRGRENETSV